MNNVLILKAARVLKDGGVVAIPSETVYGLGAICDNDPAVQKIFKLKGRPSFNPLIIHVESVEQAMLYGDFDARSIALAQHFWPGPLTMVVPRREGSNISTFVTAGLNTIAIRCPAHPTFRSLIQAVGTPIAAPSANISGYVSPTRHEHVQAEFGDRIMILNGDKSVIGLESTIVDCSLDTLKILRPGSITSLDIKTALNQNVLLHNTLEQGAIKAPGQLKHHYSPRAAIRLNVHSIEKDEALLNFGHSGLNSSVELNLSTTASLEEAAANLFDFLRHLDNLGCPKVAVAPIPNQGIGIAINERLSRAAIKPSQ